MLFVNEISVLEVTSDNTGLEFLMVLEKYQGCCGSTEKKWHKSFDSISFEF